ncbi:PREDICTED: neuroblastoma-amplified sequence [Propithecus coquereli]|uniref:neuroblastoma-amplified sequence n=1 Tax=Propithecus coquereli TaxID=379532 RepID=UPI00063F2344|nr:PREDICTED: neuroblastoma-amplified sequence [Propithecus coquereli]
MAAPEAGPALSSGTAEGEEETILYDLLVNTEWPPETEVQRRGAENHGSTFTQQILHHLLFLHQYIWYRPAPFLLPDGLVRLVNKQINWHLVLASIVSVDVQQILSEFAVRDEFINPYDQFSCERNLFQPRGNRKHGASFIITKAIRVPKDPKPQWRRVAWSYDCTLLAYAESTGTVRVFDLVGSELFVISPASSFAGDLSYAIAGLIFLEYKASAQWSAELLVINYRGELRSYLVRLLLVGGCETAEVGMSKASSCGLSAWRVLSGSPYYKQVTNGGDKVTVVPKTLGLLRMLSVKFYSRQGREQDGIFKMSLSPDGMLLAAIHFSGKLSIWAIPSLKQQGEWNQSEQPGYDDLNPDWRLSIEKRKKIKDKESFYPLIDVNWWADNAVTLARCSGALTVSSVKTLKNLLGKSCEWFEPSPQVTATHDGGFLSLECEIKLAPKRSRLEIRAGEEDEGEEDSDSDHEISAKARYFGYIKQGLYLVTEMERFAPPRKRPRTITKNYRLVSLRSTTPEELYQRKIENEEYEEALSLAHTYGLDTDLVYQRQWRKSAVNIASIQNYLSKIKKRSWVLHECLERVPENVDAAKELLQYGLKGTDLEALLAIGKGVDDGRFTLPGEVDIDNISYEELSPPDEEPAKNKKEKALKKRRELLKLVNFSKLTLEQKELCRCRLKLLTYLDRLATYEEILGVPHASEQRYDAEFFKKFRNQNIVLSARTYARESNVQALEILFTYHGSDLLPHRLAILSNFPETTSPHEYSVLLPEACCSGDSLMIVPWHEHKHRAKDWCETLECRKVVEPSLEDESEFLYAAQPELLKFRTTQLSVEKVMDWYQTRAEEIEHYARQVDCALSLIRLGVERSIPGLLVLCDNLVTLETLVYEAGCDLTLTLKELQQMKDIEKLRLLMNSVGCILTFFLSIPSKPVSFVKITQSSSEEARKLMVRLTRHTGRKQPPVSESHWRTLLQDMLTMQQNVYTCLDSDACYEGDANKLHVRLCSDRISLIKECISHSPTCYKQSAKLLGLAELLRVAGEDPEERRGQVLILLVEQALRFHDYKAANMHCQELMATGYPKSWDVCSQLGQSEGYQDLATRQELMAFALTHCPPSSIELLLAASSSLQTEILYQRVNFQIQPEGGENINVSPLVGKMVQEDEVSVPGGSSADLLHWTTATTMKVLSNTTTTTKAVLQAVSDGQWWKKSLTYLRPLQGQEFGGAYKIGTIANEDLERQGCHPFYESVISNPFVAESEVTYDTYQHVPVESFAEVLLRTGKLAEAKTEGEEVFPTTEVLLQLASDALPNDMTLALAYLLALPQVLDANRCFEKQSHSALCLQLAAYYYSLQIYARLTPCFRDKCHPLYRADPKELIKMVTRHVSRHGHEAWPEDLVSLTKQLHHYNERLLDFTQAQILQGLRKGVDVQRFTADDQYKRETILGLTETLEENVYSIALSLAQRYSVSRWEVFMTHLEFLFTDSGLSTGEIENRAQALHLFETLKTDPEAFHKHMVKYIYPTIGGFDHERLLYYFTLLENCGCADFGKYSIKPETHIRLLKKFKVVASGLNYKKLTDENMSPLEALEPVLSSQNILSISKLVPKIPEKDGQMLSPSSLYTVWLQKLFWTGDPHLIKQVPESSSEWLQAYDVCMKYFDRLHLGDLITVVDAITFSPKAVNKLSVETRKEMTRKAIKTVKHFMDKTRKRNSEEDIHEVSDSKVTYADALNHLEKSLAHLETLSHSFIVSLKNSEQETLQKYSHLYDLSRSEKGKLHDQAVAMCLDGQPLRMIQQLLEVAVGPLDIAPKDIVHSAIMKIISALSGGGDDLSGPRDPLQVLEGIVTAVHASVDKGEELVSSEDLLEWLRPFCADDRWPVRPRIHVLQVLEQSFHLTEEDSKLLVFFRTEAILKATWPQRQVDIADIENEENRYCLFMELLESSHHEVEFQHLILLLQAWPPIKSECVTSITNNPWVRLATAMLTKCTVENKERLGNEVLKICRSLYNTKQMLPAEGVKELCLLLLARSLLLPSLKLLLESPDEHLHAVALEQIAAVTTVNDSNCDEELLSLLLDAKLLVKCISTPYYPCVIDHLLASHQHGRWDAEELARHLRDAGHDAQAGSLLLAVRGTHRALRTFSTALSAGQHWV